MRNKSLEPYSQHFNFLVTYEGAKSARLSDTSTNITLGWKGLQATNTTKLGLSVSYKEKMFCEYGPCNFLSKQKLTTKVYERFPFLSV
jgi:hypothetical protein